MLRKPEGKKSKGKSSRAREWSGLKAKEKKRKKSLRMSVDLDDLGVASVEWQEVEE